MAPPRPICRPVVRLWLAWRKTQYLHLIHACDAIYPCYGPGMPSPDLNLLVALDVLLNEGSVARAA
ncbi:MAG: hypothetical protein E5V42_02200, partial [Mesorhizobium sp.]